MSSATISVSKTELYKLLKDLYETVLNLKEDWLRADWYTSIELGGYLLDVLHGHEEFNWDILESNYEKVAYEHSRLFNEWKKIFKIIEELRNKKIIDSALANEYLVQLRNRAKNVENNINRYLEELERSLRLGWVKLEEWKKIVDKIRHEDVEVKRITDKLLEFMPKLFEKLLRIIY